MTVPAHAGNVRMARPRAPLHVSPAPTSDPIAAIGRIRRTGVSAAAAWLMTQALLDLPVGRWLTLDELAASAGISNHAARRPAAELADAGLLYVKRERGLRSNGTRADYNRYALAVSG